MKTLGDPEPLYVAARRVLFDALEAIEPHLNALVLVGAQAGLSPRRGSGSGGCPLYD